MPDVLECRQDGEHEKPKKKVFVTQIQWSQQD